VAMWFGTVRYIISIFIICWRDIHLRCTRTLHTRHAQQGFAFVVLVFALFVSLVFALGLTVVRFRLLFFL
jgi:hypothetical protein